MADTYSYDLATDIGKVRRDIADTDIADAQFSDEELDSWIDEAGSVKAAAGLALLAWSAALGREDESVSTGAWKGDRRDVAGKMRSLAHDYFALVGYKPAESGAFTQFTVDLGL